jgi:hypothetical protein
MNDREIAEHIVRASYEAEKECSIYPYRDYISFEGMPEDYQIMMLSVVRKLKEKGIINVEAIET